MNPGRISTANTELGQPKGWDVSRHGPCRTLPVAAADGMFQSCWYPSAEELEAMIRGCPVLLTIWGRSHPPVDIGVAPVPEAAAMMCDHGKTAAEGCAECAKDDPGAAPRLIVPGSRSEQ